MTALDSSPVIILNSINLGFPQIYAKNVVVREGGKNIYDLAIPDVNFGLGMLTKLIIL